MDTVAVVQMPAFFNSLAKSSIMFFHAVSFHCVSAVDGIFQLKICIKNSKIFV